MKRVAVLSTKFRMFGETTEQAFKELGYETKLISWPSSPSMREPYLWFLYMLYMVINRREKAVDLYRLFIKTVVIEELRKFKPDIVVILFGGLISIGLANYLDENYTCVLVLKDTPTRYPHLIKLSKCFDNVITYDAEQVSKMHDIGVKVFYVPESYNDKEYYQKSVSREYDICYIGAPCDTRREALNLVCEKLKNRNIVIGGTYFRLRKNPIEFLMWRMGLKYKEYLNRDIDYQEANQLYNESKIVLNLPGTQMANGWSSRLLEIMSTGSLQICFTNEAIKSSFDGAIVLYKDNDDMLNRIEYYLSHENERKSIAELGVSKVKDYSETIRMKRIIDIIRANEHNSDSRRKHNENL